MTLLLEEYIGKVFFIYRCLIFIYVFMSWLPNVRNSVIGEIIAKLVEPYLAPFRKMIPPLLGFDISPIFALITLTFVSAGLIRVLQFFM